MTSDESDDDTPTTFWYRACEALVTRMVLKFGLQDVHRLLMDAQMDVVTSVKMSSTLYPSAGLIARDMLSGLHTLEGEQRRRAASDPEATKYNPVGGWHAGLVALVDSGCCPWCQGAVRDLKTRETGGVTWDCPGGCNP